MVSPLDAIIRAYMSSVGFHPTAADGSDRLGWGHRELGEGRPFDSCVWWQIERERLDVGKRLAA